VKLDPGQLSELFYGPPCLHKEGETYATRTGQLCADCGYVRHRHSVLIFTPLRVFGGITVSTTLPVRIEALRSLVS
jgi:hypothetical protein